MSKHTPGPWKAYIAGHLPHNNDVSDGDGNHICAVSGEDSDFDEETKDANTHLIAVSPEMLEALEAFVTCLDFEKSTPSYEGLLEWKAQLTLLQKFAEKLARSTFAKAEGKE